jgi:hypothetical protein
MDYEPEKDDSDVEQAELQRRKTQAIDASKTI